MTNITRHVVKWDENAPNPAAPWKVTMSDGLREWHAATEQDAVDVLVAAVSQDRQRLGVPAADMERQLVRRFGITAAEAGRAVRRAENYGSADVTEDAGDGVTWRVVYEAGRYRAERA